MKAEQIKKYYGFARKSGAIAIGTDKIMASKKIYLIFASESLSQNAKDRLKRRAEKENCEFVMFSEEEFKTIEQNSNIKAVAIKSKELAKAMQKQ